MNCPEAHKSCQRDRPVFKAHPIEQYAPVSNRACWKIDVLGPSRKPVLRPCRDLKFCRNPVTEKISILIRSPGPGSQAKIFRDRFRPRLDVQFLVDVPQVSADGIDTDAKLVADLLVGQPPGQEI